MAWAPWPFLPSWPWLGPPSCLKPMRSPPWASSVLCSVRRVKSFCLKPTLFDSDPPQNTVGTDSHNRHFHWIHSETWFPSSFHTLTYTESPQRRKQKKGLVKVVSPTVPRPGELDLLGQLRLGMSEGQETGSCETECPSRPQGPFSLSTYCSPEMPGYTDSDLPLSQISGFPALVRPHCHFPEV